ncbi:hypothetical protein DPMN_164224 [Dreissena polymorpha]|uniref:Uncharacterized protein n=1 Tax=Dreissena polymorpha TaxID=45954 RepID=A0A9D4EYA1_DREPO|nr:hypothetical protein DPMN_164224 [Dreissena polymorpha]
MLVDAEGWAFGGWFAKVLCVRGMFLSGRPFLGFTSLCRKAQFLLMNISLSVKFAAAWSRTDFHHVLRTSAPSSMFNSLAFLIQSSVFFFVSL